MKGHTDKCHIFVTTNSTVSANTENITIKNSSKEKLLGIEIQNFNFEIMPPCFAKALAKVYAFVRIVTDLGLYKQQYLMLAFITFQFNDCSLI